MNTKNLLTLTIGIALAILVFLPAQDVLARTEACAVAEGCAVVGAEVCVEVVSAEECEVVVSVEECRDLPWVVLLRCHARHRLAVRLR